MPTDSPAKPSFSTARKWGIGVHLCFLICLVFAVVVMANYISRTWFLRLHVSTRSKAELHPRTVKFLKSLTNRVQVTLYYDKQEPLYSTIASLLNEYQSVNPKCISVQSVDYLRDPATAQRIKNQFNFSTSEDKNLVIFQCGTNSHQLYGKTLADYTYERVRTADGKEGIRPKVTAFLGEMAFNAYLLAVTDPKPRTAYILQDHFEHRLNSSDDDGYSKFMGVLQQSHIAVRPLQLVTTNPVPTNCDLLIIPGPGTAIPAVELEKIDQYLNQGGRLLALFNAGSTNRSTGLEKLLYKWGVIVGNAVVKDYPEHSQFGDDVFISAFSMHPVVSPLLGSGLHVSQPRVMARVNPRTQPPDAPHAEEVAYSGDNAYLAGDESHKQRFPLMVTVEKGIKGVLTTTRIVVAGDSFFLSNRWIDEYANRDFAVNAANWLLDRTQMMEGPGPRPMQDYRLMMTKSQLQRAEYLLLAGLPGGILLLGGLVWLRRRR